MDRYYLDTSIWIDIYEERGYNGEIAKQFIRKIILNDLIIVYSDLVLIEFKNLSYSQHEIDMILYVAKPTCIKRVHITKEQISEAKKIVRQNGAPYRDSLHAIIARDHEAQLVSRDKDFEKLKEITKAKRPEDLL